MRWHGLVQALLGQEVRSGSGEDRWCCEMTNVVLVVLCFR